MSDYEAIQNSVEVDTKSVKCSSCGSNMVFDPNTQMLICRHCGRTESFSKDLNVKEIAIEDAFKESEKWSKDNTVFSCENCGAKVVLAPGETANVCPFCGTAHVVRVDELPGVKPNALIPFLLDDKNAAVSVKAWAKKKIFSPTKFKKSISPQNIKGIYAPTWTFDSFTFSTYKGRLGKHKTRTVVRNGKTTTETYTEYFNVSGTFDKFFDDIMIAAGKVFDQNNMNKLQPFKKESSAVYEEKFLPGFMAYHYEKDVNTSWNEAKQQIDAEIRKLIVAKYNADVVDYLNVQTMHDRVTYKYMLLPVYVGNYSYKSKLYNFFVNGSTGRVTGKAPVSPLRVGLFVLLMLAIVVGAYFLMQYLGVFD